ncbi:SDR family NAD(P)-dependent oxidoreductase [cyanobacterium endosymbiont of Epithemia turgida]|uniref:SDR family NAD(P)-dependent oxidoreductase n=1 Tax=cyanobacterium endosymbiont of Epithemia turgida TaxID=718217 RepID=UPI0004D164FE|nr:SDR family oxidoreductase [cyanobacterium endosymbiont of Epithemia turgida]BAP17547.1 SDR family dehydrogenase/reductase [cyanobacterium endosymbiont of Epithemia turgida isolate EtSB Lake Yunoko]
MKTALITGASSGIGTAFAQELAMRQINLILVARSQNKLYQLAEKLQHQVPIKVDVIVQDLTEQQAAKKVYDTITEKGLNVDFLVNNAGVGDYGAFTQRELSRQAEMIQLNIVALVELTYLFLSEMQQRGTGNIINVASIAGFQPLPYLSVYAATKAFVLSFSEALWAENKGRNINILALCPGPTDSNFFEAADFPDSFTNKNNGSLTSAKEVVKDALKALENRKSNTVPGGLSNQFIVNSSRFLPRELLINVIEKKFRG